MSAYTKISHMAPIPSRKKYGGLMPSEMKRLRQLEEENRRLKRLVVNLSLDKEMLQEVICLKSGWYVIDGLRSVGISNVQRG